MTKNAKKGDMAKIENHFNKKIRLGYLTSWKVEKCSSRKI